MAGFSSIYIYVLDIAGCNESKPQPIHLPVSCEMGIAQELSCTFISKKTEPISNESLRLPLYAVCLLPLPLRYSLLPQ